ncbi:MAG: hypothetical protein ACP5Q1_08500 [Anaerolineae bacterium]
MATIHAKESIKRETNLDARELERGLIQKISLLAMTISGLAWWVTLPSPDFPKLKFLYFVALFAISIASYLLHSNSPLLAQIVLIFGSMLVFNHATLFFSGEVLYFSSILIVEAGIAMRPTLGLLRLFSVQ